MPAVERYMTREPYSIAPSEPLSRAKTMMLRHQIRHLPVIDGERLAGVISERDVMVLEASGARLELVEVARVMQPAISVWCNTPLDEVSTTMARSKSDCVVVRGGHGIEGIFTAVDGMAALTHILHRATE